MGIEKRDCKLTLIRGNKEKSPDKLSSDDNQIPLHTSNTYRGTSDTYLGDISQSKEKTVVYSVKKAFNERSWFTVSNVYKNMVFYVIEYFTLTDICICIGFQLNDKLEKIVHTIHFHGSTNCEPAKVDMLISLSHDSFDYPII